MNSSEREPYLLAVDAALGPLGFTRRKRDHEWRRVIGVDAEWVHLNFGLEVINPSFGVCYGDLENLVPAEIGGSSSTWQMLSGFSHVSYSLTDTTPAIVAADLLTFALPEIERHRDRKAVIESLQKPTVSDWPVQGGYLRKRLLPLLLVTSGRIPEALDWLTRLEALPPQNERIGQYAAFADFLRKNYAV